jgi:hypothetical protein
MDRFLRALPYLLVMLAVVPVFGLMVSGSWRAAWRYTKDWLRSIAILLALGAIGILIAL